MAMPQEAKGGLQVHRRPETFDVKNNSKKRSPEKYPVSCICRLKHGREGYRKQPETRSVRSLTGEKDIQYAYGRVAVMFGFARERERSHRNVP